MGDTEMGFDLHEIRTRASEAFRPATDVFAQVRKKLQNCVKMINSALQLHFGDNRVETVAPKANVMSPADTSWAINLEKQLKIWHENPHWVEKPPQIKVSVPKGSLCNLNVNFEVGLPPDAIYNIVINPNNKRVFKNIKEVISRRVLLDEGLRQVVEVEQAAIWRFLWFSGTISVHVIVEQNRANHTVRFKQGKTGFMKRFEGCWKLEPLFLDDNLCLPFNPKTLAEYNLCTGGRGRVGSIVRLEQLVQPALIPPPPVSWYLRGITARTTEMLITDLLSEAARIRNGSIDSDSLSSTSHIIDSSAKSTVTKFADIIKSRRKHRRKIRRKTKFASNSAPTHG